MTYEKVTLTRKKNTVKILAKLYESATSHSNKWRVPTKWLRHNLKVRFSHASIDYSPPLLNALKRDKDRKFTRIYHQSFNLQIFFRKCIIQLLAIVTATTGTLTS